MVTGRRVGSYARVQVPVCNDGSTTRLRLCFGFHTGRPPNGTDAILLRADADRAP
jgi:hypothetical protein